MDINNQLRHSFRKDGVSIDMTTDIYKFTNRHKTVVLIEKLGYKFIKDLGIYDIYTNGCWKCMVWRDKINCFKYR